MTPIFHLEAGDVCKISADVLLLKHAGEFFGIDAHVAGLLEAAGLLSPASVELKPGEHLMLPSGETVAAGLILFVGTPRLRSFGYAEMFDFAARAVDVLASRGLTGVRLATTIHGTGYGLDAAEAMENLVRGFTAGASANPGTIKEVIFAERASRNAEALRKILESEGSKNIQWASGAVSSLFGSAIGGITGTPVGAKVQPLAGSEIKLPPLAHSPAPAVKKRHVFVAMPFASDHFADVYTLGIYPAVRNCGLICEKTDESAFTGDIHQRIHDRISTADLVVADLSGSRPNVYLEVGYAWGKGVPVVLLAAEGEKLHFDVARHRCIFYKNITQLGKELERLVRGLFEIDQPAKPQANPELTEILESGLPPDEIVRRMKELI